MTFPELEECSSPGFRLPILWEAGDSDFTSELPADSAILRFAAVPDTFLRSGSVRTDVIYKLDFELPRSLPEIIAEIRSSLSLQIKELAEIIGVERPTVYGWLKQEAEPRRANYRRLLQVHEIAKFWRSLSQEPLGREIRLEHFGSSVLGLLKQDPIPVTSSQERLRSIHEDLSSRASSLRKLAEKHGIKDVQDRQAELDVLTGKRVFPD